MKGFILSYLASLAFIVGLTEQEGLKKIKYISSIKVKVKDEAANAAETRKTLKNSSALLHASELLDRLLTGYDSRLRPGFQGEPIKIDVNLNIRSMGPISDIDMVYQMDCYFRQSWVDKRLAFNGTLDRLPVSVRMLDRIWKPDTHFYNGRHSYLHTVTTPNKLLRIHRDGRILYSMSLKCGNISVYWYVERRLTIKASCPMHLEALPLDTQTCPLKFGSHGYDTRDVLYEWTYGSKKSIKIASDMALSQFDLIANPHYSENIRGPYQGDYSALCVNFTLRRHMGYFVINVYLPSSLLVILSWVGFWINREATADRIALGITTVLTMTLLGIDNRRDLPRVSYSTALDYYVGTCFGFVLASILQFAVVHFFTKHSSGELDDEADDWKMMMRYKGLVIHNAGAEESHVHRERSSKTCKRTKREIEQGESRFCCRTLLHRRRTLNLCDDVTTHNGPIAERIHNSLSMTSHRSTGSNRFITQLLHPIYQCLRCIVYDPPRYNSTDSNKNEDHRENKNNLIYNSVSKIDQASRYVFPLVFLSFNILYWFFYL